MSSNTSSKTSRRRFLYMLGIGAGTLAAADTLFAKQFAAEAVSVRLPEMSYDPERQVMVDPQTRQPLYVRAEMIAASGDEAAKKHKHKSKPLPTVTAGCDNCPKCDDHCG